jgi:hypothetical protein
MMAGSWPLTDALQHNRKVQSLLEKSLLRAGQGFIERVELDGKDVLSWV